MVVFALVYNNLFILIEIGKG